MATTHVLIVEDDQALARALQLKLQHDGFIATIASNGKQALELLQQPSSYQLILLDLMMPEVDGFQVLAGLRDAHNTTPVLVLSNLGQTEDEQRSLSLGAKRFFVKSNTSINAIVSALKAEL